MRHMDSGVIAPMEQVAVAGPEEVIDRPTVLDALQNSPVGAVLDLPLPQLPEGMPPFEPPAFLLSRKISEDQQSTGAMPAGLPGLNGTPSAGDPTGLPHEVSPLLGEVNTMADQVVAPMATAFDQAGAAFAQAGAAAGAAFDQAGAAFAQAGAAAGAAFDQAGAAAGAVFDQAGAALGDAFATASDALSTAMRPASGAAALPSLPPLPADPVAALLNGIALPALPGVDLLIKPILDLLGSFGSGIIGAFDPTAILNKSSQIIEIAMQVGRGSMATVDELWQSQAARNAQAASRQANIEGQETGQRGIDISELTQRAAAVVQQGNAQLLGIATSFATEATALAPAIMTPPAQAALIASATQHLGRAVSVVNATRGDLAGKTAELSGMVQQLVAPGGGPAPHEVAQTLARNIGQPILDQVQSGAAEATTKAASLDSSLPGASSQATAPASVQTAQVPGTNYGASSGIPVGPGGSGVPGGSGAPGTSGALGASGRPGAPGAFAGPKLPGMPGAAVVPPVRPFAGIPGTPLGAGAAPYGASTSFGTATPGTTSSGGNGFMGGPGGAAGHRNNDEEHSRSVQPYSSPHGSNADLTGPLGESTPDVIGVTHPDEIISSDYEQDQF
ncbi:hypothetical protein ACL02S_04205 [Nocardia sp. 004]|uniref:hypothetical protein n=1 Tax=Nocardia sp. 004 TaxID=3385978 RepID=UPI0039A0A072